MKPALHFPRIGKTLLASALVATFGIASLPAEAKPKQASAAAGKPIKGEINAAKALTFMYGNATANSANDAKMGRTHHAKIRKIQQQPDWSEYMTETFAGKSGRAEVAAEARYTEQGKEKYLIITGITLPSGENDCFACIPLTQAALFAKEGGQWVLETQNKNLGLGGSYGEILGKPKQIEVGRGKFGFLSFFGGYRQDCLEDGYLIVMPYNGTIDAFGFDFGDGVGSLTVCHREGYEPEAVEKCKGRKQKPVGKKEPVEGGVVITEINTEGGDGDEDSPDTVGFWDGKLMTVDTGADYYDIVVQGKRREEICGPITWQTHRFRFENGKYKKAGAK